MEILAGEAPQRTRRSLLLALLLALPAMTFGQTVDEYEVKAAFLYNFTKFVEWPSSKGSSDFVIGIFGDDPFGTALEDATHGKTVNGHSIRIRRLKDPSEARSCGIVFVTATDNKRTTQLFEAIASTPVLTVGETSDFMKLGGMIRLSMDGSRIGVVINSEAAGPAGLKISAKLMSLAQLYGKEK
jgi:hypothetical protein